MVDIKHKLRQELESLQGVKVGEITVRSSNTWQEIRANIRIGQYSFIFRGKTVGNILQDVEKVIAQWGINKENAR